MPDLVATALSASLEHLVRSGLRGVWLRGRLPAGPFVWAANHHSWWDPFVASAVLSRAGRPASLLMRQDNLSRYAFARRLGVFGSAEPRTGLRYLSEGRVLVVFPEGELRAPGPLGRLANGAAWYASRAGAVPVAVAVRVVMRGHQAPEAYVSITAVEPAARVPVTTGRLAEALAHNLFALDHELGLADPRAPLADFRLVLSGRRSWDERIDAMARRLSWAS